MTRTRKDKYARRTSAKERWLLSHHQERLEIQRRYRAGRQRIEVYVARDSTGQVIYVGRTNWFARRISLHKAGHAAWLSLMDSIEHLYFETYGDSLVAEALLIREHQPCYNKDGVTK